MAGNGDTTRTHEPSLRELTSELDGLRDLVEARLESVKELMNERDRLYRERDDSRRLAVDAALTAVKEQTKQSFEASEKAIVKAEDAQKAYNTAHNDLARKMDDQNKATMPRYECEGRFQAIHEKIDEIKNALSGTEGASIGGKSVRDESRANVALVVAVVGVLVAMLSVGVAVILTRS